MPSLTVKLLAGVVAFAFGSAAFLPAQAETVRKHKKPHVVHAMAQVPAQVPVYERGTEKFRAGPIYDGRTYLGDDPDPFIRSQIARDVNAVYGGND